MKFLVYLLLLAAPEAFADTLFTMGMDAVRSAGVAPQTCGTEGAQSCSFAQTCSELTTQRASAYLYENAAGDKIPNFMMAQISQSLYQCGTMSGAIYAPPAAEPAVDPMAFQRWMVEQPPQVQADFNRLQLAYGDSLYSQPIQPFQQGEKPSDYIRRQYREAAARIGLTVSEGLAQAIDRMAELYQGYGFGVSGGYGGGMSAMATVDWSRLPAVVREQMQDPFLNAAILSDTSEVGHAARRKMKDKTNELNGLVDEIREQIISVLTDQIQRYPDRRESLEGMMLRIRTAEFSPVADPMELMSYCPSPNAFYDPTTHSLRICPQMMGHPREHLRMVLAHELGHSIDPCAVATPFYRVSTEGSEEVAYSVLNYGLLAQLGMPVTGSEVSAAVVYPANPYREVLSCLASERSLNARLADPERSRTLLVEAMRLARARGESTEVHEAILANLPNFMRDYAGCSMLPGESRQQEGFADWIAGEVMGKATAPTNLTEVGGMFFALECPGMVPELNQEMQDFYVRNNCAAAGESNLSAEMFPYVYQLGAFFQQLSAQDNDEHSASVDRIDRLFANQPQLRARIGCEAQPKSGEYCAP